MNIFSRTDNVEARVGVRETHKHCKKYLNFMSSQTPLGKFCSAICGYIGEMRQYPQLTIKSFMWVEHRWH